MAAKRFLDDGSDVDPDKREEKRMKTTPSFSTVVREAIMLKSLQSFCCTALEPLLRRVIEEELERGINRVARTFYRSPSFKLQAAVESSNLQLIFTKKLSLPIFTGSKIEDEDNNPLQIQLIDTSSCNGGRNPVSPSSSPLRIELVVLDGDFPGGNREEEWTSEEFSNSIVKERDGRRPLLTGEVNLVIRDGTCSIGDIEITDNSSWIRSRTFRIGARVVPPAAGTSQGVRIKEAKTEAFKVKDHRGELYKKHYPPSLNDDVWRLEKIGKDGAFHRKLAAAGILTVQQFLKDWIVDPLHIRRILGVGMSDRMWEVTIKHAVTCDLGHKLYLHRQGRYKLLLNPICEVIGAKFDDEQVYQVNTLSPLQKAYVERMVLDAYKHWDTLEEVDRVLGFTALAQNEILMGQGAGGPSSHGEIVQINDHQQFGGLNIFEPPSFPNNNLHMEYTAEWNQNLMMSGLPPTTMDQEGGHGFHTAD